MAIVGAPTILAPYEGGSYVSDPVVTLSVGNNQPFFTQLRVQFSELADFSTSVKDFKWPEDVTGDGYFGVVPGAYSFATAGVDSDLRAGTTVYVRARYEISSGDFGSWTSTRTITMQNSVPYASNLTPRDLTSVAYVAAGTQRFVWTYNNTWAGVGVRHHQVEIRRVSDDLGLLTQSMPAAPADVQPEDYIDVGFDAGIGLNGVLADYKDVLLYWHVKFRDLNSAIGAFSDAAQFYIRDAPTIEITSDASVASPLEALTWSFTASDSRTAISYKVDIYEHATSTPSTSLVDLAYTTSTVVGAVTSWDPTGTGFRYTNGLYYTRVVTIVDTANLSGSDTETVLAFFPQPDAPTYVITDPSQHEYAGYLQLLWPNTNLDPNPLGWSVYRKLSTEDETGWVLLGEVDDVVSAMHTFNDYTVPINIEVDYAILQIADTTGTGTPVESTFATTVAASVATQKYWLTSPYDADLDQIAVPLRAKQDSFSDMWESAEIPLINRGRRKEYGTHFGYEGTLTVDLFDEDGTTAREKRLTVMAAKAAGRSLIFRSPFGDTFYVAANDITFDRRAGVGSNEYGTLTIPYSEVVA